MPNATSDDYEVAVLWVPDPTSYAGWVRRKIYRDVAPRPKKPPMGFRREPPAKPA